MKRKLFAVIGLTIIFTLVFNLMTVNLPSNSASADQLTQIATNVSSSNKQINSDKNSDIDQSVANFLKELKEKGFKFCEGAEITIKTDGNSRSLKTVCNGVTCPENPNCINQGCSQGVCNDIC